MASCCLHTADRRGCAGVLALFRTLPSGEKQHTSDPFGKVGRDFCLDRLALNCTFEYLRNKLALTRGRNTQSGHKHFYFVVFCWKAEEYACEWCFDMYLSEVTSLFR